MAKQLVDIPVRSRDLHDFLLEQGSTAFSLDGGRRGGLPGLLPDQCSTTFFPRWRTWWRSSKLCPWTEFNSVLPRWRTWCRSARIYPRTEFAVVWVRSSRLCPRTGREFSFSFGDEEEDEEDETAEEEEETEQMDLEEQPSRFQGHFRPRRYCASILRGGLCWRGSSCTFAHSHDELHPDVQGQKVMVAPVIMQPQFQQSVLFFSDGASDPVHDQSPGHSSCMQIWVRIVQNCTGSGRARRRQWQWQVN